MKLLPHVFFSLFFFTVFFQAAIAKPALSTADLEREVVSFLKKNGSKAESIRFVSPIPYNVTEKEYDEGLRRLVSAISRTRHPKDFADVTQVYAVDDGYKKNPASTLVVTITDPVDGMIGALSRAPEKEVEHQAYLSARKDRSFPALRKNLGADYALFETSAKVLCNLGGMEKVTKENAGKLFQDNLKVELKEFRKGIRVTINGRASIRHGLYTAEHTVVIDQRFNEKKELTRSTIEIVNPAVRNPVRNGKRVEARFTPDCLFRGARLWSFARGRPTRLTWLDNAGDPMRVALTERQEFPLRKIYQDAGRDEKAIEALLAIAARKDRVLVTILDSGVDYNHPSLAYKIPRPQPENADELRKQMASQLEKKRELQEKMTPGDISQAMAAQKQFDIIGAELRKLGDQVALGWNFDENEPHPYDFAWDRVDGYDDWVFHGTMIAGASSEGSDDIAILPIIADNSRSYVAALDWSYARGSRIINMSFAGPVAKQTEGIETWLKKHPDVLAVTGAGNDGRDNDETPMYPSSINLENLITNAAVDAKGGVLYFSNYGVRSVHLGVLGTDLRAPIPEGSYLMAYGTSLSTAVLTRVAAKIKFLAPRATPAEIIAVIRDSAVPIDELRRKTRFGGMLNEERALEAARKRFR